ncbi:MAG: hypothetical protein ACE5GW_02070 [Planctomycetota bacterium]
MTVESDDRYQRFFGEIALDQGFVTAAQLYEALTIQAKRRVAGRSGKLLGQILLEMGVLSAEQIQQVLDILYPPPGRPGPRRAEERSEPR